MFNVHLLSSALYERVKSTGAAALAGLTYDQLNTAAGDSDSYTALHYAAKAGDAASVKLLIAAKADIEMKACYGEYTPLRFAVDANSLPAAQALLQAGADVNAQDVDSETPLHIAYRKHMVKAKESTADGSPSSSEGTTRAAGHCGCTHSDEAGTCAIADLLLQHKADPNLAESCFFRTPLNYALQHNAGAATVLRLAAAGAALAQLPKEDADSETTPACDSAVSVEQVAALAACGADFLASNNCQEILNKANDKREFERVKKRCLEMKQDVCEQFRMQVMKAEVMKADKNK